MQMDDRKRRILRAIIDDYILTGIPVGSRTISKKYETGLSSATIRNEMSDLEELGFLDQPHVSAGRVPSAKAYRLYVDSLLQDGVIPDDSAESVLSHFSGRIHQMEDVIDHAARVLSSLTQYTAVVLSPKGMEPRLQTIQLVPVSIGSALVVIVTDQGVIRDSVIHISPEMSDDTLYAISRTLTNELRGCTLSDACKVLPDLLRRMEGNDEILRGLYGYFAEGQQATRNPHVAVGGTSNMLSYPEYSDVDKARSFLSLMETRDKLAEIVRGNGELAFTVRIGPETGVPEMADCSIVTATYSTRGGQQGTIGVIGHLSNRIPQGEGKCDLLSYKNISFCFDPAKMRASDIRILATRSDYPDGPAKKPDLTDCAFTSGIERRTDGRVNLYSGIGDCEEGRVVIDNPFGDLLLPSDAE